jgi:uncharacterized protein (TIRG00374 family)
MVAVAVSAAGVALVAVVGHSLLSESIGTLGRLDWWWLPLAVVCEAGSMAAYARTQRKLLQAGGNAPLHLGSVMAVTYAGNAISASLPLAGSEVSWAYSFRQFNRRGIEPAVVAWALAVSGVFSSLAFGLMLAGGALATDNGWAIGLGLTGAVVAIVPTVVALGALRSESIRRHLNHLLDRLVAISRRLVSRPGPGAEDILERLLDRLAALRLPRMQYAEVLALAMWNWVADCICLAIAIRATGTAVPWQGLFLAYGAGMTAAGIGLTPGGLGIIEATLSAALVAAGLNGRHALAAVLVYRLVSFWLVVGTGWAIMAVLRRQPSPALEA